MQKDKKRDVKKIANRFNIPVEFVMAGLKARHASTMYEKLETFNTERNMIEKGDQKAVRRRHKAGKLLARERIAKLLDSHSFEELDQWHRPYETGFCIGEDKGRGDAVITGYGEVNGRSVTIWAQDATVMGGTMGTVHARKVTMLTENALNNRTPIVAILDSEGVRAQDAIQYPDFYSASSIAYFQTLASGVIPKIALVMGPCKSEQAVIAGLSDFLFMVKNNSDMHLTPAPLEAAAERLGDPWIHASVTGCCDVLAESEENCLLKCKQLLGYLPSHNMEVPPKVDTGDEPNRREEELLEIVPVDSSKPYSMYNLISLIVDNGELFEIRRHWARNLITGFARLDGNTVGVIANNPQDSGGCMTLDAADKMSRFVRFCDSFNVPLIWLADTPAFLPAVSEETRGLIRHGARMIMANTEASVPQITVEIRKHYGGGRLSMPGQILGGDLSVAWPTYEPGLMGAEGAVNILYGRELKSIAEETPRERQKNMRVAEMKWGLDMMIREATQKIIDPRNTRPFLIRALRWLRNKKQDLPSRKHENFRM